MNADVDWKAEYEKELARAAELKKHVREKMIGEAVRAEAQAFWSIDPDLAAKLADTSKCSFDEGADVVIGASEAVQRLVAEKPYLFAPKIKSPPPPPRRASQELLDQIHRELGLK